MKSALLVLLCFLSFAGICRATDSTMSISDRYSELDKVDRTSFGMKEQERFQAIINRFDALFGGEFVEESLASRSDDDLDLLFRAANLATFYSFDSKYADLLLRANRELVKRNKVTLRHRADVYGALIQTRRFSEANALYRTHPEGLIALPAMSEAALKGPSIWSVNATNKGLERRALNISIPMIVVLVHPLCHFSRNAIAAVSSDPVLHDLFVKHAKLVVPPERDFKLDLVSAWNEENPQLPMSFIYSRDDWPMFSSWATPTFYFFRDGRLEKTVAGWPKEGRRTELIQAAKDIGLLPAP